MCAFRVDGAGTLWTRPAQHRQRACRLGIGRLGGSASRHDRPESDRHCARRRWQRRARERQRAIVNRNRQLALVRPARGARREARFKRRRDVCIAAAPMPRRQPAIKRLRLNLRFRVAAGAGQNDQCALGNVDRAVQLATPRRRVGSHHRVVQECFSEHGRRSWHFHDGEKKSENKNSEKLPNLRRWCAPRAQRWPATTRRRWRRIVAAHAAARACKRRRKSATSQPFPSNKCRAAQRSHTLQTRAGSRPAPFHATDAAQHARRAAAAPDQSRTTSLSQTRERVLRLVSRRRCPHQQHPHGRGHVHAHGLEATLPPNRVRMNNKRANSKLLVV
jgi:hypothetical protein